VMSSIEAMKSSHRACVTHHESLTGGYRQRAP
jgi:hypothetical protein